MKMINVALLVIVSLVLISCGGAEERKAAYLAKAEQSMASGDYDKARIELKNVLQIDPKDAAAHYKLGQLYEGKKDFRKAFQQYSQASELAPDNIEYQAQIGKFYLVLGNDIDKATEILNKIKQKDANNIDGQLLEAGILLKQKKVEESLAIAKAINAAHPENKESAIFLASIYSMQQQYPMSIVVLEAALKHHHDDRVLNSALVGALFNNKDFDKTEKLLQSNLDQHPEVYSNYTNLAHFYQNQSKLKDAENTLRKAVKSAPDDTKRKMTLVDFIRQSGSTADAISEVQNLIKETPSSGDLRLLLGQLQYSEKSYPEAIQTYEKAITDFSDDETGIKSRIALASIYMQENKTNEAEKIVKKALSISPNDVDVNFLSARIAIFNKNYEKAVIALRTVVKDAPDNIEAYLLLAESHKALKEDDQAKAVLVKAYENNRTNREALKKLAAYYVKNNNKDEGAKIVNEYVAMDGKDYEMLSIKASLLNAEKKYSEASKVASEVIAQYPDKDQGYVQSVPYLLSQEKTDDAIKILRGGYEKTKNTSLLNMVAEIQLRSGTTADAISTINDALGESDSELLYLTQARAYIVKKDMNNAIKVLRESIGKDNSRQRSYVALAKMYLQKNERAEAIKLLSTGMEKSPNLDIGFLLANIYELNKDYDKAIALYEKLESDYGDNILILNNLAALLSEYKTDDASLSKAKLLADKLSTSTQPVVLDTVGWVYYKAGDYTAAVKTLKSVLDSSPDVPVFNYHLGMAYFKSGDKSNAKTYLSKALEKNSEFPGRDAARSALKTL